MLKQWPELSECSGIPSVDLRPVDLRATIRSFGYNCEREQYDWRGLERGDSHFLLLQYTVGGQGQLRWEGRDYFLKPGQLMVLHIPHDHRYWLPAWSAEWRFLYYVLSGDEVLRLGDWFLSRQGPVLESPPDRPLIKAMCETYQRLIESDGSLDAFSLSQWAYGLVCQLCREVDRQPAAEFEPLRELLAWLREHVEEAVSVEDMAARCGWSRYHFSRLFRAYTGESPRQHLERLRIEAAVGHLHSGRRRIGEVAEAVGFADANYFSKVFRRVLGCSPSEFLKQGY